MSAQFWPCPGCSRHVKRGDAVCPFCGATASVDIPTRLLAGRLSRAALFAAGTMGAAVAATACGGKESSASAGSSSFVSSGAASYGGFPIPIETEDSSASAGSNNGGPFPPVPLYGAAMIPIQDASASDGPSEVAADAADAITSETAPSVADGATDAIDASATTGPTDSSSAADVPMLFEAAYGSPVIDDATTVTPAYGGAVAPDE